jgi:hypothetical protein
MAMTTERLRRASSVAPLVLLVLAACGSTGPEAPASGEAPVDSRASGPAAAPASPSPAGPAQLASDYLPPPLPARDADRPSAEVEACVEARIHTPAYDGMHARDARRRLRKAEVRQECEGRLAAR